MSGSANSAQHALSAEVLTGHLLQEVDVVVRGGLDAAHGMGAADARAIVAEAGRPCSATSSMRRARFWQRSWSAKGRWQLHPDGAPRWGSWLFPVEEDKPPSLTSV
jgi:hypothetical protein